jgi:hypothetical protein
MVREIYAGMWWDAKGSLRAGGLFDCQTEFLYVHSFCKPVTMEETPPVGTSTIPFISRPQHGVVDSLEVGVHGMTGGGVGPPQHGQTEVS